MEFLMTTTKKNALPKIHLLASVIALTISANGPVHAVTFNIGEVEGQLDSQ